MTAQINHTNMTDRDREEDTGQFTTEYTDEDFIQALNDLDGSASTSEIANMISCDRRTAYLRLNQLKEDDQIVGRKVGNSILWEIDS